MRMIRYAVEVTEVVAECRTGTANSTIIRAMPTSGQFPTEFGLAFR